MYIGSASTTVKFHDFQSGDLVHNYQPGPTKVTGPIRSTSWSNSSNWLAVIPHSGLTEIVSTKNQMKLIHTIQHIENPTCVAFQNTTKKLLGIGTKDGQILIYDMKARGVKKRFARYPAAISYIEFTAKDTHLVAGCKQTGDIMLYSNVTNNLSCKLKYPKINSVSALRTNPIKRNIIMAGNSEGSLAVWDTNVSKFKYFMAAHKAPVTSLAFSPINSDLAISTGLDRQVCFYDIEEHKCVASVAVENSMMAVSFSEDAIYFSLASQNGIVYIHDSRNIQKAVSSFQAHNATIGHVWFQDNSDGIASPGGSFVDDCLPEIVQETPRGRSSGLFGMIRTPVGIKDESIPSPNEGDIDDSFMAVMGLNLNDNKMDSPRFDHKIPEEDDLEVPSVELTPNPSKFLVDKVGMASKSSTPLMEMQKSVVLPPASPILPCSQSLDMCQQIRALVQEELQVAVERLDYKVTMEAANYRKALIDLHLGYIGECIKLEDLIVEQGELNRNHSEVDWSNLIQENASLKSKVASLRQQLAILKSSKSFD